MQQLTGHAADALAAVGLRSRALARPDISESAGPGRRLPTRALMSELGFALAAARLPGALPRLARAPRGDGHTVVDIPGWKAPEVSLAPMRAYLRALGYDARSWGFGTNTGNPRRDVDRLAEQVLELAEQRGSQVSLVGWSLGGVIAREVARRHPEAVRRVITYGSPLFGGSGFSRTPIAVPLTVMFTRRDGVVAWEGCLDRVSPYAEHVEVFSTHIGMGVDPDVWGIVADRLARS